MPAPDPALHREPARDVLAAEEFGMPAGDPALHHGPVTLPGDPTGIAEPHDVLAAEEFALPAGRGDLDAWGSPPHSEPRERLLGLGALVLLATLLLRRRRS
jgi:MYXO-CTERM domain-containing protein